MRNKFVEIEELKQIQEELIEMEFYTMSLYDETEARIELDHIEKLERELNINLYDIIKVNL